MKKIVTCFVLVLVLFTVGCSNNQKVEKLGSANVKGTIEGLTQGKVEIGEQSGKVNKDGTYAVSNISSGNHKLIIYYKGEKAFETDIFVDKELVKNITDESMYNFLYKKYDLKKVNEIPKDVEVYEPKSVQEFIDSMESIENSKSEFSYNLSLDKDKLEAETSIQGVEYTYREEVSESQDIDIFMLDGEVNLYADIYIHHDNYGYTIENVSNEYMSLTGSDLGGYKLDDYQVSHYIYDSDHKVRITGRATIAKYVSGGYSKSHDYTLTIYYNTY